MPDDRAPVDLSDLLAWAAAHVPALAERACEQILSRDEYYRDDRLVPADVLRESVRRNMRFLLDALTNPGAAHDLGAPTDTGRERALQGVPLAEVLRAYRISFAVVWDALADRACAQPSRDVREALLHSVSTIWQLSDEHALAVTEGYRAATVELLRVQQDRRGALVEALLSGQLGAEGTTFEAKRLLGFPPGCQFVVVVAEVRGLAEESLSGVEAALARHRVASAWRLTPVLQMGLVALGAGDQAKVLEVVNDLATTRVGLSPSFGDLSDTPRALQLARVALGSLPVGSAVVSTFSSSPLAALVAANPQESRRLARQVLGAVEALPEHDRTMLLDTLYAYLDHEGAVTSVAQAVHCHPNTVRYRLRRLHQLTGRSLTDPRDLADLRAAALTLRLIPGTVDPDNKR